MKIAYHIPTQMVTVEWTADEQAALGRAARKRVHAIAAEMVNVIRNADRGFIAGAQKARVTVTRFVTIQRKARPGDNACSDA